MSQYSSLILIIMANSKTNMITHGYHGKVGDQFVLRSRGGKSVIAAKPDRDKVIQSQPQKDQCKRFSGAVNYAKAALQDPVRRLYYESRATKSKTAYNMAVADFLTMPWIDQIDATGYNGNIGDKIVVMAANNSKVSSMAVAVSDPSGIVLESGPCQLDPLTNNWFYSTTTEQIPVTGNKIVATVHDLPGHVVQMELTL